MDSSPSAALTQMTFDLSIFLRELEIPENTSLTRQVRFCPLPLCEQADEKGFTLMHHAVLACVPGKIEVLIQLVKEFQSATDDQITKWVNSRTHADKFTPLHLASFKGNMDAVHALIAHGSDKDAINAFGLNMLHTAAQGDAANTLNFFYEKKVDLNAQDHRGSTPLHWACYSNSEIALSYLLAWGPQLNIQDQDGQTPLHLAVKSVETVESTRPVRFLLIRGADKTIRDNVEVRDDPGMTPLELANSGEVQTPHLLNDIRKMLGEPRACDFLMLSAPTRLVKKSPRTMIVYLGMTFATIVLQIFFVFRYLKIWEISLYASLAFGCLTFFTIAACLEPGYVRNQQVDFKDMLNVIDSTQLCPDCCTIRTSRSRHCSVCGHCVERFDHHCPWINNCVGVRNHNYFFAYIVFQMLLVAASFGQAIAAVTRFLTTSGDSDQEYNQLFDEVLPTELSKETAFVLPFMVLLICFTGFFLLPLLLLVYVHTNNFLQGKSTMERLGRVGNDHDRETRIINSGIRNDTQVYRYQVSRIGSFAGHQNSSVLEEDDNLESLIQNEPDSGSNPGSKGTLGAAIIDESEEKAHTKILNLPERQRQLRLRNKQLTTLAIQQSTCFAMCTQRQIRGQREIYEENLVSMGLTEAKPQSCVQ